MADFARWLKAAEPVLPFAPGRFEAIHNEDQHHMAEESVEHYEVASAVLERMMREKKEPWTWTGSITDLAVQLHIGALQSSSQSPSAVPEKPPGSDSGSWRRGRTGRGRSMTILHGTPDDAADHRHHPVSATRDAGALRRSCSRHFGPFTSFEMTFWKGAGGGCSKGPKRSKRKVLVFEVPGGPVGPLPVGIPGGDLGVKEGLRDAFDRHWYGEGRFADNKIVVGCRPGPPSFRSLRPGCSTLRAS